MDLHKRHHSACDVEPDAVQYRSFSRNTLERASTGTLKQPRLPGSEKFRFSQAIAFGDQNNLLGPRISLAQRRSNPRPISTASDESSDSGEFLGHVRARSKRRPVIPISKNTSQMLNNTNADLGADTIEFVRNETLHLANICKKYIDDFAPNGRSAEQTSDGWSSSSSEQSLERTSPSSVTAADKPAVFRVDNSNFATICSNRLRTRTLDKFTPKSPTHSTSSSEEDVWVLRVPQK